MNNTNDDTLDLMRDEFIRIKAITDDEEIKGICDRAISGIGRRVPLIVENENLTASLRELAMIRELMVSTHPVTLWQDVTLTCYVTTKGMTYQGHTLKEALTKAS